MTFQKGHPVYGGFKPGYQSPHQFKPGHVPVRPARASDPWMMKPGPDSRRPAPRPGELNPSWKGSECGYDAAHKRVKAEHGPAPSWPCTAQCGAQAHQWAYCGGGETELIDPKRGSAYSPDPYDYVPLCRSCHWRFDRHPAGRGALG